MNILITAATQMEINAAKKHLDNTLHKHQLSFLVSDVGMMATTFHLTKHLLEKTYDLVIQLGIAGAFNKNIALGQVVEVVSETYGDLGAEDNAAQISIFDMGIMQHDAALFTHKFITNNMTYTQLPQVSSLSVNNCSGNEHSIQLRTSYFDTDIETMEGIGLHYVAAQLNVNYLHIRSISNYVTVRDKSTWNIPLALTNLSTFVANFIAQLHE